MVPKTLTTSFHFELLLSHSLRSGYEKIVEMLLNNGADPNYTDTVHRTALNYAIDQGNLNICSLHFQCKFPFRFILFFQML